MNYREKIGRAGRIKNTADLYAKLLNLSKEGLRYFEQRGILNPERDVDTGYRIYGGDESSVVISCKKYRKYGFNLDKVRELIQTESCEEFLEELILQSEKLVAKIEESNNILSSLYSKIDQINDVCTSIGTYRIVTRPEFFWLPCRKNKEVFDQPDEVKTIHRWNGFQPYPDTVIVWNQKKLETGEGDVFAGQIIEKDSVHNLQIQGARFLPKRKCLYSANAIEGYLNSSFTMFDDMLNYMKKHSIKPTGDGVARTIRIFVDANKKYVYVSQLWIPID